MGLKEERTITTFDESFTLTSDRLIEQQTLRILVPRGAVGKLRTMDIKYGLIGSGTPLTLMDDQADMILMLLRRSFEPLLDPTDEDIERLNPLWLGWVGFAFVAGSAPVEDSFITPDVVRESIEFEENENTVVRSTGVSSNNAEGWQFVGYAPASADGGTVRMWAKIKWEMEYIETSRSQSATWSMMQITEEESQ